MTLSVEMAEAADLIPKSPLAYPDLCGKHRLQVEVQMMDREIGFLEVNLLNFSLYSLIFLLILTLLIVNVSFTVNKLNSNRKSLAHLMNFKLLQPVVKSMLLFACLFRFLIIVIGFLY